ncbi:hypothetical protein FRC01_007083 [Tulasnella sp. 417]|nr:hypothetical protein FRC01_007083 [Tulasnella sp. 417]
MAPRATQASQARRGGPSQSQTRRAADSEDEEEDFGAMGYDDDDDDGEGNMAGASQALLPENSRGFNAVFDAAQRTLRHTFGMEVVELMTRSDRDAIGEEKKETGKKKSLIGEEHEGQDYERPNGAILAWKSVEPVALTGILQLVLLSYSLMGASFLSLKRQLKSFHLYFNTKPPSPGFSSRDEQTLFDHLSDMIKQNHLDRVPGPDIGWRSDRRCTPQAQKSG